MAKTKDLLMCFGLGAVSYGLVEIIARGYTHWTMPLTAGVFLALAYLINQSTNINIFAKCLLGCVMITSLELAVGLIVNVRLGWNVWDYSDKPLNFMGQVCPQFSLAWLLLSLLAFWLCGAVSKYMNKSSSISFR